MQQLKEACQPYDARLNEDFTYLANSLWLLNIYRVAQNMMLNNLEISLQVLKLQLECV